MSFRDRLTQFIRKELADGDREVSPEDSLLDSGLMDSVGLMQVLAFVEEETGVRVPDGKVTPDNFETVEAIERLVRDLRVT